MQTNPSARPITDRSAPLHSVETMGNALQPSPVQATLQKPDRLLRLPDVETLVGLKKSAIYAGVKDGSFPQPVKLSRRAVCWPESKVQAWIAQRINGEVNQ
jgi:prophage regulatory protein